MKKNIYICLLIAFGLVSCEEYLDVNPEMGVDETEVYESFVNFRGAVDRAYDLMYDYAATDFIRGQSYAPGGLSDECQREGITGLNGPLAMNQGNYEWESCDVGLTRGVNDNNAALPGYMATRAIRAINLALANIDKLTDFPSETDYTEEEMKNQLLGQCYTLRAWHFHEIICRYGPMPILDHVFSPNEEFDVERPTYQECVDWMVKDLDKAIDLLPESWNSVNKGRIDKTTARAIKAQVLLYAASPNMNLPYGVDPKGGEGYNHEYLERSVVAYVDALKSVDRSNGEYGLVEWGENGDTYWTIWNDENNRYSPENILTPPVRDSKFQGNHGNMGANWFKPTFDGSWAGGTLNPTQNAVDKFETVDGYDIKDAPAGSFDPKNPYDNRDPRLRFLIYVNGDDMYPSFPGATNKYFAPYYTSDPAASNGYHYNFFKNKGYVLTGYVVRGKNRMPKNNNQEGRTDVWRRAPYIRVAQLYLDLAEAANELYGPTGRIPGTEDGDDYNTALGAVNRVRQRATMAQVRREGVDYAANSDVFRNKIRNERAVELFMEGHRWRDIRRWRIAKQVLSEIRAADVELLSDGTYKYSSTIIPNARVFEDKHYWYPFDRGTMSRFKIFEQNPGWDF